ncbi:MAG: glyoxalase superfamily protein [Halopseudomonas sp.]
MERVIPVLPIDDYDRAVDFYVTRLGFTILFEHRHEPGFPVYMVVKRGDLIIGLSEHGHEHQGSEIYIIVDDVDSWSALCFERGVTMEHPPEKMSWGNTEMLLTDPFRNSLRFTQESTHAGQNTPNKKN